MPEFCDPATTEEKGLSPNRALFMVEPTAQFVLFTNARIFDGITNQLSDLQEILVHRHIIRKVGPLVPVPQDVKIVKIDCDGMTLMPGLIDMHSYLAVPTAQTSISIFERQDNEAEAVIGCDPLVMGAFAAQALEDYLQQGFTTCRDGGGNVMGLAKAIQKDRLVGPRLYVSGPVLSQTGGGGELTHFRSATTTTSYEHGSNGAYATVCDGRAEILKACRQNLRNGAAQIKVIAGGSLTTPYDPLHGSQFTLDEIQAAVEVANDYGTYVMAHAYHDQSIHRCIDAGVKCIEHGYLMTEETMERIAKENIAICVQSTIPLDGLANERFRSKLTARERLAADELCKGANQMMELIRKHKPLIISGGAFVGKEYQGRLADNIIHMVEMGGLSNYQALRSATHDAAQVLKWSGPMNPYPDAKLGVIQEGAYADIILVNGNPLEDITKLSRNNIHLVMKDGVCQKMKLNDGLMQVVTFRVEQPDIIPE